MSQVITQQCEAITKRRGMNTRCKHRTSRGRYCWQHLKALEGFRIKKSNIPNAGLGLFWQGKKPIKKNDNITEYSGQIVNTNDPNYGNPYVLQLTRNRFIDASKTNEPGLGRWENDSRKRNQNTKFAVNRAHNKVMMKATRNIKTGTELTVPYGRQYWTRYPIKNKRLRKGIRKHI